MPKLTLTRETNESVVIGLPDGRRMTVTVVSGSKISGNLRLRFDAPSDITIHREEIQAHIDAEQRQEK